MELISIRRLGILAPCRWSPTLVAPAHGLISDLLEFHDSCRCVLMISVVFYYYQFAYKNAMYMWMHTSAPAS